MNKLYRLKIVHRDIKPSNILLQIMLNGEHVYKLSDFGAAKMINQYDEELKSLVGSEKYLYLSVYEVALINRNKPREFVAASIDLWSLGVTL